MSVYLFGVIYTYIGAADERMILPINISDKLSGFGYGRLKIEKRESRTCCPFSFSRLWNAHWK